MFFLRLRIDTNKRVLAVNYDISKYDRCTVNDIELLVNKLKNELTDIYTVKYSSNPSGYMILIQQKEVEWYVEYMIDCFFVSQHIEL